MIIKKSPGTVRVFDKTKSLNHNVKRGIKLGMFDVGRKIKPDIQRSILDTNKTGRVYLVRLGGNTVRHRASAPGQAPANLTGKLQRSVNYRIRRGGQQMEIGAGNDLINYARGLELGNSRIAPRPYIKPAITKNNKNIIEFVNRRILESIHR